MLDMLLGRKTPPPSFRNSDGGQTVLLQLDACVRLSHQYKNRISSYPVENGFSAVDHILQDPDSITIEGVVTNSPLKGIFYFGEAVPVSDYNSIVGDGKDRVVTALEMLLLISGRRMVSLPNLSGDITRPTVRTKPMMFDFSTNLRTFTDMVIEELDIELDSKTGDSLPFKATCKNIYKSSTKNSTINFTNGSLSGAGGIGDQTQVDDMGQQNTEDPNGLPAEPKSVLKGGIGHLFDWR